MGGFPIFRILSITTCLILLDLVYFYFMKSWFSNQILKIQGSSLQPNLVGAILCYISLTIGLYYFIIKDRRSIFDAFLLGIVIYSVYDLTNLALFRKWSPITVIIDSLWGGVLFGLTTSIIYHISSK
jgi:uncharacterized membrane protein